MTRAGDVAAIAAELRRGAVVAVPTDTVYGLAVMPHVPGAVEQIFALKRRPEDVALPVLVDSIDQAHELAAVEVTSSLRALATSFWPGALTVVVPRRLGTDLHLGGDPATVGLRCPDQRDLRELLALVGPLAVTSANRHGEPPCTTATEVLECFADEVMVLDRGVCAATPSTVVILLDDRVELRRSGAIAFEEIVAVLARLHG